MSDEILQGYAELYLRRCRTRASGPFDAGETSALAASVIVRASLGRARSTRARRLQAVDRITQPILEGSGGHSPAADLAGIAWAEAYGVLPLTSPPEHVFRWVLARGSVPGAISGAVGSAWRSLFLMTARPLLDPDRRRQAEMQLDRWRPYLRSKLRARPGRADTEGLKNLHLIAVAAEVGDVTGDSEMAGDADRLLRPLGELQDARGDLAIDGQSVASHHLAQFALAAHALGKRGSSEKAIRHLCVERRVPGRPLIWTTPDRPDTVALSPWVPRAVAVGVHDRLNGGS